MDNRSDNDKSEITATAFDAPEQGRSEGSVASGVSRRTFSRSSLAGAGVLLTLANGAAWAGHYGDDDTWGWKGKGDKKGGYGKKGGKVCVSTMILESFQTASHFDHHRDNKKFEKYMSMVDSDMNPLPGYDTLEVGRETCIFSTKQERRRRRR